MENNIIIKFIKEDRIIELNFNQPDLGKYVHDVVTDNLLVSDENITISSTVEDFDTKEFKEIIILVHKEFQEEIETFYKNIEKEISTYHLDEDLSSTIIDTIKSNS